MIIIKHDDGKIKRKIAILSVFSRLFGIHDEDFIVTFPRIQVLYQGLSWGGHLNKLVKPTLFSVISEI